MSGVPNATMYGMSTFQAWDFDFRKERNSLIILSPESETALYALYTEQNSHKNCVNEDFLNIFHFCAIYNCLETDFF